MRTSRAASAGALAFWILGGALLGCGAGTSGAVDAGKPAAGGNPGPGSTPGSGGAGTGVGGISGSGGMMGTGGARSSGGSGASATARDAQGPTSPEPDALPLRDGLAGDGLAEPIAFAGAVKLSDATVVFRHQQYTENANHGLASVGSEIVSTTYDVKVIENDLVKVAVLPSYGGRILSMIYKPTNQEMLFQNSVGTPFGNGEGSFFYNWLMVYGGIFPTFSEAEHGKMWLLPWTATVLTSTEDEVAVRMNRHDDILATPGLTPGKFNYGRTDLDVTATVRVVRGSAAVGLDIEVANTRSTPVKYEYWTCTTLAPGSSPGKSSCPANTEIVTPVDRVSIDGTWGWMRGIETPTADANVFSFNKLASFSNWSGMGIAYAYPAVSKRWWGALNRDNKVGIFRVSDPAATPGLKYWTWGVGSVNVNPDRPSDSRAYIELWAGHSQRFFSPAQLAASEKKSWTETYLPTVGLSKFSEVSEGGAAYLSYVKGADATSFQADLFSSLPSRRFQVVLSLEGTTRKIVLEQEWIPDATKSSTLTVSVPAVQIPPGTARYALLIKKANGEQVLRTDVPFN